MKARLKSKGLINEHEPYGHSDDESDYFTDPEIIKKFNLFREKRAKLKLKTKDKTPDEARRIKAFENDRKFRLEWQQEQERERIKKEQRIKDKLKAEEIKKIEIEKEKKEI